MRDPIEGRHWLNDYSFGRIVMTLFDCVMLYVYIPHLKKYVTYLMGMNRKQVLNSIGLAGFLSLCAIIVMWPTDVPPDTKQSVVANAPKEGPTPDNWLDGKVSLKGGELTKPVEAYRYAHELKLTFIEDDKTLARLVADGTLVPLSGLYIELFDVWHPYVLPITNRFVNRLSQQYAAQGCGKLVVTGAIRFTTEALSNSSTKSVHPTGMAVDFRIPKHPFCRAWLQRTLSNIERSQRVDTTKERGPPHFHAAIVTEEYRVWLNERTINEINPELEAMARALYYEGAISESDEGLEGIAAVIKNRVLSSSFPNTILEVTAEGAAGRNNGSCQFSYMCDGQPEDIETLCRLHPIDMPRYWGSKDPSDTRTPCQRRWDYMLVQAERLIASKEDPTNGAVLYYAGPAPYWARGGSDGHGDLISDSIITIGNHTFGRSKWLGRDVAPSLN